MNFKANILFRGKIECITGLHIGGSQDKMEIGGVDAPVLRDPVTSYPYLPGSSIKGRIRALVEYSLDAVRSDGKPSDDPKILSLFGTSADYPSEKEKPEKQSKLEALEHPGPTPLIIRDCQPDESTISNWKNLDSDLLFTEYKAENTIDRVSSEANPRFMERIVAGSCFNFEMVYTVYDLGKEKDFSIAVNENIKHLFLGLRLLEDNSLGKSGSRGYGKVRFLLADPLTITNQDYIDCTLDYKNSKEFPAEQDLKPLSEIEKYTYSGGNHE